MAADLARGLTLEAAAKAHGLVPFTVTGLNRATPEPRLFSVPEIVGSLFVAPGGKTLGPLRGLNGWYFARVDRAMPASAAAYDSLKGQISSEILQKRQQSFFAGFVAQLRARAKVEDQRTAPAE
jgi:hypothetical protein